MKETCQINDFLKGLKPEYSKLIASLNKRIMFLLDERNFLPNISVEIDRVIVKQVLDVLVGNSIKYTNKGYIKVGYKVLDNNVLLFVIEDTGVGVDAATLASINEKLETASSANIDSAQNISDISKLIKSIDAKIRIESQKDLGTTAYVSIDLQSIDIADNSDNAGTGTQNVAPSEPVQKPKGNPVADIWKGRTILIAEDELVNYMFLEVLFEDTGAVLIHASDGQQAIDLAKEHPEVELILMDIKMPNVNGLEATKAIKAFRPQTPIIAQTAYAMQDDEYKALQAGCNEYISKPIDANKLMGLMKKYLHI